MLLENKALIYCILGSCNEVLMHYLGINLVPVSGNQIRNVENPESFQCRTPCLSGNQLKRHNSGIHPNQLQNDMNILQLIFQKAGYKLTFDSASASSETLLYISNPDGTPRWIWPSRLSSPLFLRFYHVSNLRSGLFAALIRLVFWLGLQKRVFKSLKVSIQSEPVPYKSFSPENDKWALFTGTLGPNQKGIIVIESETRHRFIKIALGKHSAEGIENEAWALKMLGEETLTSFTVPQLLIHGMETVQMTGLPQGKRAPKLTFYHQQVLLELNEMKCETAPLCKLAVWNEALSNLDQLAKSNDTRLPKRLIRKLQRLSNQIDPNKRIHAHFSHGDFTPWNTTVLNYGLGIFDWELSRAHRPKGFDAFHFIIQNGILVGHKPWSEIRKDLENQTRFLVHESEFEQYLALYLLMNISWYLTVYSRQENWHLQINWLLEAWLMAVSDLTGFLPDQRGNLASDLADHIRNESYAALKFVQDRPEEISVSSDMDLCLKPETAEMLVAFLNNHPLVKKANIHRKSFMTTLRTELKNGSWLMVDAIWQLKWKNLSIMNISDLLDDACTNSAGMKKASRRDEAIFTGLFYGLNGSPVPAKYSSTMGYLEPSANPIEYVLYNESFPKQSCLKKMVSATPSNQRILWLKNTWNYLIDSIRSVFHQKGFTVTFSGVDGAGKSTVIESLKNRIEKQLRMPVVVIRHRPSLLPILSAWTKGKAKAEMDSASRLPRQGQNAKFFPSLLRFSYYYIDYLIGQFYVYFKYLIRGYVVLYDRYYFDFINDSKRSNIELPAGLTSKGYSLLLKPDLNLFLFADPETILARKQELSADTITDLTVKYRNLFRQLEEKSNSARYISIRNENLEETLSIVMQNVNNLAA
jgi:thymidylate kinase